MSSQFSASMVSTNFNAEQLKELLLKPDVLTALQTHPSLFEHMELTFKSIKIPKESKDLAKSWKMFKNRFAKILDKECVFIPQGFTAICLNNQKQNYVGTNGLASCVLCVVHTSNKTALGHCDGAEEGEQLNTSKVKNYTENLMREMGENAQITLAFEESTGLELAQKLVEGFNKFKCKIQLRPGKYDGGFVILKTGQVIPLYGAQDWVNPSRNNDTIQMALKLSVDTILYHVTNDGLLMTQKPDALYEVYSLEDTQVDRTHRQGMMKPKNANTLNDIKEIHENEITNIASQEESDVSSDSSMNLAVVSTPLITQNKNNKEVTGNVNLSASLGSVLSNYEKNSQVYSNRSTNATQQNPSSISENDPLLGVKPKTPSSASFWDYFRCCCCRQDNQSDDKSNKELQDNNDDKSRIPKNNKARP